MTHALLCATFWPDVPGKVERPPAYGRRAALTLTGEAIRAWIGAMRSLSEEAPDGELLTRSEPPEMPNRLHYPRLTDTHRSQVRDAEGRGEHFSERPPFEADGAVLRQARDVVTVEATAYFTASRSWWVDRTPAAGAVRIEGPDRLDLERLLWRHMDVPAFASLVEEAVRGVLEAGPTGRAGGSYPHRRLWHLLHGAVSDGLAPPVGDGRMRGDIGAHLSDEALRRLWGEGEDGYLGPAWTHENTRQCAAPSLRDLVAHMRRKRGLGV